jgi:hypothetical protein
LQSATVRDRQVAVTELLDGAWQLPGKPRSRRLANL